MLFINNEILDTGQKQSHNLLAYVCNLYIKRLILILSRQFTYTLCLISVKGKHINSIQSGKQL